jgi:hypothetical protein
LWGLGGVDIHADQDHAFRGACRNERLEVARWLFNVVPTPCGPSCVMDVRVFRLRIWSKARAAWCSWV